MAQLFDDGVVLDELLGVGVGELDRTAPAEEVLGRSDGGTELGIDGVAPVGGQARDGVDVDFAEDAGLVEEEGLGWPSYGKSGFAVLSLANASASSAGAGLTVVSTAVGTKGETLTIEPRRDGIFECDCE